MLTASQPRQRDTELTIEKAKKASANVAFWLV
jgi:hypothetical protein